MNKTILIALVTVIFFACGNTKKKDAVTDNQVTTELTDANIVNVYYFHGKQRCKTCIAVQDVSKKAVEEAYAGNNNVRFIEVNTSEKENQALVEKYEISWNALIVAKGEDWIDLTDQGFANAVNNPDVLAELIKTEINNRLN